MKPKDFIPNDHGWPNLRWTFTSHGEAGEHELASGNCSPAFDDVAVFNRDITGRAYALMLDIARDHAFAFSLVWRDDQTYFPNADSLATDLRPFLCYERYTDEWRGTKLFRAKAWARWYKATHESLSLIAKPESLFAWTGPELPEDLAFYTESGKGWLGSTAHENIWWIDLGAVDRRFSRTFLKTFRQHL